MAFAIYQYESAIGMQVSLPPNPPSHLPPHPIPPSFHGAPTLCALYHISNSHWLSILHMVIYMFQCYSLKSPHPLLLPLSPKVSSLYLYLLCCQAPHSFKSLFTFNKIATFKWTIPRFLTNNKTCRMASTTLSV